MGLNAKKVNYTSQCTITANKCNVLPSNDLSLCRYQRLAYCLENLCDLKIYSSRKLSKKKLPHRQNPSKNTVVLCACKILTIT